MICKVQKFVGIDLPNFAWKNWIGKVDYQIGEYFRPLPVPSAIQNLVYVVAGATAANKHLRAIGSGWAFEDLDQSDSRVVSLSSLVGKLTYVVEGGVALTDAWKAKQNDPNASTHLVHVEAGIEIGALCEMLQQGGWAMPALGGSNGQSIAGAISTSTHGGDWDQPPLPDYVRAIHLVTDGGQELWIERESDPITTDARLKPVLPCAGTKIMRNDAVFDAAVVSLGRFGVIYSLVLEVRRAFRVVEVITTPARLSVFQALTAGMKSPNVFDRLFGLLAQDPPPAGLTEGSTIASAASRPYFFELRFNSLDPNGFWVRRRWITILAMVGAVLGQSTEFKRS